MGQEDIIISADPSKYVTLPIQHEDMWQMYQTSLDNFWTPLDVYIATDKEAFLTGFTDAERQYLLKLLAIMSTTHYCVINKGLFMKLMSEVEIKEASYFFGSQADTKKTHFRMYSLLLDELLGNKNGETDQLIGEVASMPAIRQLVTSSITETTDDAYPFAKRLLAFASIQGIIFPSIMILFKFIAKQYPASMPGLTKSIENMWRDEYLHLDFSCMLFQYIDDEIDQKTAHDIVSGAVASTKELLMNTLPTMVIKLEKDTMEQFIESCADKILFKIGKGKIYNKENPFEWVEDTEYVMLKRKTTITSKNLESANDFGEPNFEINVLF